MRLVAEHVARCVICPAHPMNYIISLVACLSNSSFIEQAKMPFGEQSNVSPTNRVDSSHWRHLTNATK